MADRGKVYEVAKVVVSTIKTNPPSYRVSAEGTVRTGGWKNGRLDPHVYIKPPADGIQDLDFTADRPDGVATQALQPITSETLSVDPAPEWIRGFRVHSETNSMEGS